MGNRTKKNFAEAMSNLQSYLRRDDPGKRMLESINRYLGELRQTQATLKTQVDDLQGKLSYLEQHRGDVMQQAETLVKSLDREKALHRQTSSDLERAKNTIVKLQTQLEKPDIDESDLPQDMLNRPKELMGLLKELRRRMPRVPTPGERGDDKVIMFDVEQLVSHYRGDEYMTVGMFVVANCMMGFSMGFRGSRIEHNFDEDVTGKWIRWMAHMIGETRIESELHYRSRSKELDIAMQGLSPSSATTEHFKSGKRPKGTQR